MTGDNILKDLFDDRGSSKNLTIFLVFLVTIIIYHATVFWVILHEDIQSKLDVKTYTIEFDEKSYFYEESRIVNDDERATLEFSAENEWFNSHSGFGMLFVNISYTETSGEIADPCDTVSVDLTPTGATAEWSNENNELSAMSSDCETMSLVLHIFPDYNGTSLSAVGGDEQYWLGEWQDSSPGQGTFNLEVEVSVNGPPGSIVPGVSDSDEQVNVTWEAVFFDTMVS